MKIKKIQVIDGQTVELDNEEVFYFSCCDCGLVHKVCIAIERNGKIGIAMERNLEQTRRSRLTNKIRTNLWLLSSMFDINKKKT